MEEGEAKESERFKNVALLAFTEEVGTMSKACGQPLGTGRDKEMDSPLELPEGTALLTLRFYPGETHFGLLSIRTVI